LLELLFDEPIFIGFKASRALRHLLESLGSAERKYVSSEDSTSLRLCHIGDDVYVGRLVRESLATDQVDDIRRNILSILRKLGPVVPLPATMRIFSCRSASEGSLLPVAVATASDADADAPDSSFQRPGAAWARDLT